MKKRTQILIDRDFQLRLALELMVVVLVVPLILWADFYLLGQYALSQNPEISSTASSWGLMGTLLQQQWALMLVLYLVNFGVVYAFIVFYTHRIAGPVYRFSVTLKAMTEGKLGIRIKLRKNDYFENLGEGINAMAQAFSQTIADLKTTTGTLSEKTGNIDDQEIKDHISALEKILGHYEEEEMANTGSKESDSQECGS